MAIGTRKVYFIPEAGPSRGLGHLYRCIAVADMVADEFDVSFVSLYSEDIKFISKAVLGKYKCIPFEDIRDRSLVILDGYGLNLEFQVALKQRLPNLKVVLIDDYIQRKVSVDAVINHSPEVKKGFYKGVKEENCLLGIQYAMLRNIFLEAARNLKLKPSSALELVVAFGGSDPQNFSKKIASMCLSINELSKVHVVLGSAYSHDWTLLHPNLVLHRELDPDAIFSLFKSCSHGIIPSSTMLFEALAVGLTTLSGAYIDNQMSIYRGFLNLGAIVSAGDFSEISAKSIRDFVMTSSVVTGVIDGESKSRIVRFLNTLAA